MEPPIVVDDKLAAKASELGKHRDKSEAVQVALREYVAKLERMRVVELFGTDLPLKLYAPDAGARTD